MPNTILDMTLGNPEFLHPYWDQLNVLGFLDLTKDLNYKYHSMNSLKKNIKLLHEKVGNANVDGHIVIGNGVTQLLNGLIALSNSDYVYAEPPHYHKFPEFAYLNLKYWGIDEPNNTQKIVTIPNNPDGKLPFAKMTFKDEIIDLNYNWPQYGQMHYVDSGIMLFGLAKAIGFASARIGWAIIRDKELAEDLETYVEHTTGGVSIYSQKIASRLIKKQLTLDNTVFEYGEKVLDERWKDVWFGMKFPFEVLNGKGMYLWCKGKKPKSIKVLSGELFGMDDSYFRISMGVNKSTWEKFKELYAAK